jgi:hypothetical protein
MHEKLLRIFLKPGNALWRIGFLAQIIKNHAFPFRLDRAEITPKMDRFNMNLIELNIN